MGAFDYFLLAIIVAAIAFVLIFDDYDGERDE